MEFAKVSCGTCEKEIGFIPVDNVPQGLEIYCECCKQKFEEQNKEG